ncbi:porin [Methylophaga sp. OBS3]|uniref:porin n=1 Tax=Methylophaga sp. OBS3 TaxID=2991934 RepID=UPI0022504584|nr:porin [Methylophaga sp. OBS3]MCX4190447.1 porin [Methylophaga sp. OBS3]
MKKTTLATLVGAAAFAAAGAANATIVVGGENGYEFSVDGNINQFFIASDQDSAGGGQDNNEVANGLLPAFFGFNVSAPEINGLKIGARVSISPSTNNFTGNAGENEMEQREAFGTVDGSFGQVLFGKALGLYGSNEILAEQTLFGVGATGVTAFGGQSSGTTTLGRIGYGYDYADWRSQIRYTTPDMNGFKAAFAVMDAVDVTPSGETNTADFVEADPRFEGQISYATAFDNGSVNLWLAGMTQEIDANFGGVVGEQSVESNAYSIGTHLKFAGFEFVGSYFDNEGVGAAGGLEQIFGADAFAYSAVDANGEERDGDGWFVQAGYRFAGTTLASVSFGESTLDTTSGETDLTTTAPYDKNELTTFGIYHDVTANLKLVAEYSMMETELHDGTDAEVDVFTLGGFITW